MFPLWMHRTPELLQLYELIWQFRGQTPLSPLSIWSFTDLMGSNKKISYVYLVSMDYSFKKRKDNIKN